MRRTLTSLFTTALLLVLASAALGQATKVYWTETQFGPPRVWRMNLDGTTKQQINNIPTQDFLPRGIQWSPSGHQLYYSERNGGFGSVKRVNENGSGRTDILTGLIDPIGLQINWSENKMYITDRGTKIIYRANTDGTGIQFLVSGGSDQLGPVQIDRTNSKLYFGNITQKSIERMDLDGSNRETVVSSPDVDRPFSIAIDEVNSKIYWGDQSTQRNDIARCDFDGSNVEIVYDGPNQFSGIIDIGVDGVGETVYWVDELGTNEVGIWKANFDGSDARRLHATGGGAQLMPTSIYVTIDPNSAIDCMTGNVDLGNGSATDIMFFNGTAGGTTREVVVTDGIEVLGTVVKPPAGGNDRFVIHGNIGRPHAGTVTALPRNIGDACYPILLSDGAMPAVIANAAGRPDLVGESSFFGTSTPNPSRAPSTILQRTSDPNLPVGTVLTFQGAIYDPGSAVPRGVSMTNGITLCIL